MFAMLALFPMFPIYAMFPVLALYAMPAVFCRRAKVSICAIFASVCPMFPMFARL